MYNSFYCLDYCCGNCNFRYCCSNETYLVDQNKCKNNLVQIQLDLLKFTSVKTKNVNSTLTTTKMTSSSSNFYLLNFKKFSLFKLYFKEKYSNVDTCELTNFQPKKCSPSKRFCCGTCQNQYCCNDVQERLNQFECKFMSNYSSMNQDNQANSYIFWLTIFIFQNFFKGTHIFM